VVALADDREAAALEALDQPHLPERLRAIELLGEDPSRQVAKLLFGSGRGKRRVTNVVVQVQVGVVDPDGPALPEGDEAQLLAEAGDEVEPPGEMLAELLVVGRRALEERGGRDVHVRSRPLQVQERRIQSAEPVLSDGQMFPQRALV
jgi:hypothetical protein